MKVDTVLSGEKFHFNNSNFVASHFLLEMMAFSPNGSLTFVLRARSNGFHCFLSAVSQQMKYQTKAQPQTDREETSKDYRADR